MKPRKQTFVRNSGIRAVRGGCVERYSHGRMAKA